ncbi:4,5-dioxygenase [Marinomonas sp. S3726]|uniref:DOPA 4,5-dioxygenase family protein n=1 Tax=Marinomonas sp. S3726 TaxID=579484 RepID=UPI0005FA1B1C|nr:DOPA 4,5-dioxygenase family protein [Marinomonas sp. S3726]KJZ15079.1 4,5-dioxygenase [Marinomonas sp. S3726]
MNTVKRPVNNHKAYHAHVYFDESTLALAKQICQQAGDIHKVKVGRFHEKLVGPHPKWSCQIAFTANVFDTLIPWLEANRQGLSIFVHGLTGDDLKDHTEYAYWLGEAEELNLAMFR